MYIDTENKAPMRQFVLIGSGNEMTRLKGMIVAADAKSISLDNGMVLMDQGDKQWVEVNENEKLDQEKIKQLYEMGKSFVVKPREIEPLIIKRANYGYEDIKSGKEKRKERRERERKANKHKGRSHSFTKDWEL